MIKSIKDINKIFNEIDSKLEFKINVFVIGGGALMFHKLKPLTKDLDLIVNSKKEYNSFYKTLKKLGFKETILTKGIQRLNISSVLEKENARIDLFLKKVCSKMIYSNLMIKRSKQIFQGKKLSVFIASLEDVFVFKSITDREGDKNDCEEIIKQNPNWQTILTEILEQSKKGENIWITYINERINEFQEKGYAIPITKKLEKETKKYYEKIEKQIK